MRSASVIFMSQTEAITCLPQIVTLCGCEERMGDQRGTKVAPWCSTVAAEVGEKAHLGTKRHWLVKKLSLPHPFSSYACLMALVGRTVRYWDFASQYTV